MRRRRYRWPWFLPFAATLAVAGLAFPAAAPAEPSTPTAATSQASVPMFGANPAHTGEQPGPGLSDAPYLSWTFETRGAVAADAVLAEGTVYVGTQEGDLTAIDATTGEEHWRAALLGPVQTPAVIDGVVYASSLRFLDAFDAATGELLWQVEADAILSAPTVAGGLVYVGSWGGVVTAIEAATGTVHWHAATDEGVPLSSPAVATESVYVVSEGESLYAFDANTGTRRWRIQTGGATSSPAVAGGIAYIGVGSENGNGELAAVDAATGDVRWRVAVGRGCCTRPAVADGLVYVGVDFDLVALDAAMGAERWRWESGGYVVVAPAVAAGGVYVGGLQTFAANSRSGFLYAIEAETGAERWRFAAGSWVSVTPTVANGAVYFGTWDGQVFALAG